MIVSRWYRVQQSARGASAEPPALGGSMGAAPGVAVRVAQRNARALIPAQREGTELIASLELLPE
jgi:hypothetical protein